MKTIRLLLIVALLSSCISALHAAANLLTNPSFENFTAGTSYGSTTTSGITNGGWRYFSVNGANGSLLAVTPGHDGNIAIKLTRGSSSGDSGIDIENAKISASPGNRYHGELWAKSDSGSSMILSIHAYNGSQSHIANIARTIPLSSTYRKYDIWYKTPANTAYISFAVRIQGTGSIYIDNCRVELDNSRAGLGTRWVRSHPFQIINGSHYHPLETGSVSTVDLGSTGHYSCLYTNLLTAASLGMTKHHNIGVDASGMTDYIKYLVDLSSSSPTDTGGWYLTDEPDPSIYQSVADAGNWLKQYRPDGLIYLNAWRMGSGDVDQIYAAVQPDIWCGDTYPFHLSGHWQYPEDLSYFSNLKTWRDKALAQGVPYFGWLQAFEGASLAWREPSESEMRMNAWSHLTMGYKGILWYIYDGDGNTAAWGKQFLDADRNPRPSYYWSKVINSEVAKQGKYLRYLNSTDVRFVPNTGNPTANGLINWSVGAGGDPYIRNIYLDTPAAKIDALIGFFTDDHGQRYFMIQNLYRDTTSSASAKTSSFTVYFGGVTLPVPGKVYRLDRSTGQSVEVPLVNGVNLNFDLPGGTAELYSYQPFTLNEATIESNTISSVDLENGDTTAYTVTMTAYDPNGYANIKDMRMMLHNGGDFTSANGRGYFAWGIDDNAVREFGGNWVTGGFDAIGGGRWNVAFHDYGGYDYVTPVSVSTSTTTYTRTVEFKFTVKDTWALALDQKLRGFTHDINGTGSWVESTANYNIILPVNIPPTGSIVINGGNDITLSTTTNLYITASDDKPGAISMRLSSDNSIWGQWENYVSYRAWSLAAGEGVRNVYVQFKDVAGNISPSYSDSIILDYTPPKSGLASSPGTASDAPIKVTFSGASDAGSGVKKVELWYRKNFGTWTNSGLTSAGPSGTFDFTPSGSAKYYFDLIAEDNAGNRSSSPVSTGDTNTLYSPTYDVSGRLVFQSYADDASKIPVTVEIINKAGGTTTRTIYTDSSGNFLLSGIAPGSYDIAFKADRWLRKIVRDVAVGL